MSAYQIAALPGDGIGPEVMEATLQVVDAAVAQVPNLHVSIVCHLAGAEHFRNTGVALPKDVLESCRKADAVLLSAIGLPDVRKPDGTEVQPDMMMGLRKALGLYAAVRPCRLLPGVPSPLADVQAGIDFVILRENLEGLFASFGGGCVVNDDVATDTMVITREGTRRIVDYAFQLSRRRNGRPLDGKRMVTCVDKANIFRSLAFFRKVFHEVSLHYSDIESNAVYVDAMSLYLVQNPAAWDVLVMENQFGDILSDLGAGLIGGLGVAPSAEVGDNHGLFQPSHGSAPDIAGKNKANPVATMLSAAMMFDWLAVRHSDDAASDAARLIETAVQRTLAEGTAMTADVGGVSSTSDVGAAVIEWIARLQYPGQPEQD